MTVYALIEENYKNSIWCKQTLSGMRSAVKKKKYELVLTETKEDALSLLEKSSKKIIMLLGTSQNWMLENHDFFCENGIHTVIVSCQLKGHLKNASYVLIDHASATFTSIDYLTSCKKSKIALYGVNPDSSSDTIKADCFKSVIKGKNNIYYNNGNLEKCFDSFAPDIKKYNAVICANYIASISLVKNLPAVGVSSPDDIFIISFGNSMLGKYFEPALTSVTLNHVELGNQAVLIYAYLKKSKSDLNITLKIPCQISAGKTTNYINPCNLESKNLNFTAEATDFYDDETVLKINKIESLLNECEDVDFKILYLILEGKKYEEIASILFSSENTVKYRVKRMMKLLPAETKNEFIEIISSYIDKNRLIF